MKSRILSLLVALCLLITLLPQVMLPTSAATYSGTCGDNLTWTLDTSTGVLSISGRGDMAYWESSKNIPWANYTSTIQKVQIGSGVVSISDSAFYSCTSLTSVTIPNTVTVIDAFAFYNCAALTSVTIPGSVRQIGSYAFYGCSSLSSVGLSNGLNTIGRSAFNGCSKLGSLTIPGSVMTIENDAFCNCVSLVSLTILNGVRSLGPSPFSNCPSLSSITIPNSVTYIDSTAFDDTGYYQDSKNWQNGVLFIGNHLIAARKNLSGSYTVPGNTVAIADNAFSGCTQLKNVTIPDSVTAIGSYAFYDTAYYNDSKNWKNNVLFIGNHLIAAKSELSGSYAIPSGTRTVAGSAFSGCSVLNSVTVPNSVTFIGHKAFNSCKAMTSITLPNTITTISPNTFSFCEKLTKITIPNSVTAIDSHAFQHCRSLASLIIPKGVKAIGDNAFLCCFALKDVSIPNSVTALGPYAFYICSALKSVSIPNSVTYIPTGAFANCTALTSVTIPNTVTSISAVAFDECSMLTDVYYWSEKALWEKVAISYGNAPLQNATVHFGHIPPVEEIFSDVKAGDYFGQAVMWAVGKGITTGTGADTFSPERGCTRGQIVTFLWRAAGCPDPIETENPFTDISADAYYYKAVLWAVENGITTGTTATKFAPEAICTRGQVATFLWRAAGKPEAESKKNPFKDVDAAAYYYDAVLWAVENKVTTGTTADKFAPDSTCTRGQIVTFLYRAYN